LKSLEASISSFGITDLNFCNRHLTTPNDQPMIPSLPIKIYGHPTTPYILTY